MPGFFELFRAVALALVLAAFAAAPALADEPPLVVFLGDSLTAGYGLPEAEAFPALLRESLLGRGLEVRVVNGGVSGDTTAGGLRRLDWLLRLEPAVLVVGLGGNDGLRGLPVAETEANLRRIVATARERGVEVLLLGMMVPTNYGPEYGEAFAALYPRVASEEGAALVPFLLEGVGGVVELNQGDGIHPTAEGQERVAANVLPYLEPLVRAAAGAGSD
ncbi:MAG: arylesterase [Thermoanaerobaculia bacterium]|nr:arylesterase [Thermoanaerobaculia bacterium]